ncbi:hypothetical protein RBI21_01915 [Klebsiella pneumoniae]|nr:hypothetical protein RBI21_01915 [Klebsiella pneumoniae]
MVIIKAGKTLEAMLTLEAEPDLKERRRRGCAALVALSTPTTIFVLLYIFLILRWSPTLFCFSFLNL